MFQPLDCKMNSLPWLWNFGSVTQTASTHYAIWFILYLFVKISDIDPLYIYIIVSKLLVVNWGEWSSSSCLAISDKCRMHWILESLTSAFFCSFKNVLNFSLEYRILFFLFCTSCAFLIIITEKFTIIWFYRIFVALQKYSKTEVNTCCG